MPQDVTYTDASRKFQALAGLETLTASDSFFLVNSFNRAALNAYHESDMWPRFLVVSEERTCTNAVVPFTQSTKNDIGEFIRIHKTDAYDQLAAHEYRFYVTSAGANIVYIDDGATSVYVTYKKAYNPAFTEESTDIPQEFLDFMLFTALADFYTGDGQTENAAVYHAEARRSLDSELFRLEQKNNRNLFSVRYSTHLNKQQR